MPNPPKQRYNNIAKGTLLTLCVKNLNKSAVFIIVQTNTKKLKLLIIDLHRKVRTVNPGSIPEYLSVKEN
jgi:SUMO ligase MMS21 Smc5/6 complex component